MLAVDFVGSPFDGPLLYRVATSLGPIRPNFVDADKMKKVTWLQGFNCEDQISCDTPPYTCLQKSPKAKPAVANTATSTTALSITAANDESKGEERYSCCNCHLENLCVYPLGRLTRPSALAVILALAVLRRSNDYNLWNVLDPTSESWRSVAVCDREWAPRFLYR